VKRRVVRQLRTRPPWGNAPVGGEQAVASIRAHVSAADSYAAWQAASEAPNPVTPGAPATILHSSAKRWATAKGIDLEGRHF
jgi:hypothetical protein